MVTDFGIARAISDGDSRLTATGIAIGTPTYMSPEQAAGERTIDGRSDLYSLGILGYQMLTGEPPFIANSTPAILVKHISERPIPVEQRRADVPQDLARLIMILLEKDPANRFPSASAVVAALDTGNSADRPRAVPAPGRTIAPTGHAARGRRLSYAGGCTATTLYAAARPTPEEWRRWEAPQVVKFRRKLAPYLFVNGVIVIASIVGQSDFFGITVIWSIYLAFKYAKLWADGYDWRDVFRQPRERDLIDVADDTLTYARGMFNRDQRKAMREQRRSRLGRAERSDGACRVRCRRSSDDVMRVAGNYGDRIRRAETDRDEILRLLERMPSAERSRIPDVGRSADALAEKVKYLAIALSDIERSAGGSGAESIESEISKLEGAANPLDESGKRGPRAAARVSQAAAARARRRLRSSRRRRGQARDVRRRAAEHQARPDAAERRRADAAAHHVAGDGRAQPRRQRGQRAVRVGRVAQHRDAPGESPGRALEPARRE